MSLPKLLMVLLLASLLMVEVSSVHPSDPADTSEDAPERISQLHLAGRGSEKITVTVQGDSLHVPRFANQEGAWHAWADDLHGLTPPTPMGCDDDHDDDNKYASIVDGHKSLKDLRRRVGKDAIPAAFAEIARGTAKTQQERSKIVSLILADGRRHGEPADIWKTMSCAVLISEQHGRAWRSKEAAQLRSMGYFTREDVVKELGVIAWPNDCSEPITLERDSL